MSTAFKMKPRRGEKKERRFFFSKNKLIFFLIVNSNETNDPINKTDNNHMQRQSSNCTNDENTAFIVMTDVGPRIKRKREDENDVVVVDVVPFATSFETMVVKDTTVAKKCKRIEEEEEMTCKDSFYKGLPSIV